MAQTQEQLREKARLRAKRWRDANPKKVEEYRRAAKPGGRYHLVAKNSEYQRRYGITVYQFHAMGIERGWLCDGGCGTRSHSLCVDHCHVTGRVRGLLCTGCNHAIGQVKDRPEVLRKLASYLERPHA